MQELFGFVLIYLVLINVLTWFVFWLDYRRSRNGGWLVPNSILLLLVFIGGTLGALRVMAKFKHKRYANRFRNNFWWIVFLQILVLIVAVGYYYWPEINARLNGYRLQLR